MSFYWDTEIYEKSCSALKAFCCCLFGGGGSGGSKIPHTRLPYKGQRLYKVLKCIIIIWFCLRGNMGAVLEIPECQREETSFGEHATVSLVLSQHKVFKLHILLLVHLINTTLSLQWNSLWFLMLAQFSTGRTMLSCCSWQLSYPLFTSCFWNDKSKRRNPCFPSVSLYSGNWFCSSSYQNFTNITRLPVI